MRVGDVITKIVEIVTAPLQPLADAINNFVKDFANTLKEGVLMIIHKFEEDFSEDWESILPKEVRDAPVFKEWSEYAKEHAGKKPAPLGVFISSLIGSSVGAGVGMGMGGFGRDIQNWFNTIRPVTPLTPDILAYGKHTGKITDDKFETDLLSQGFAEEKHSVIYDYYKPKLSPSVLLEAERRIENLDIDVNEELKAHGFNDKEINVLRELSYTYPSPTDFIRFAVREVFTDDKETQEALKKAIAIAKKILSASPGKMIVKGKPRCNKIPEPRASIRKLLNAAAVRLPQALPCKGVRVATRKKLTGNRKPR